MTTDQMETDLEDEEHRKYAAECFNATWDLLDKPDRTPDEDDLMLHMAHTSMYHWLQVGEPVNFVRGEWQLSRVHAVLGRAERAIHHAERCLHICEENGIGDFDLAFAYEALARAHAIAGNTHEAAEYMVQARDSTEDIEEDEDRDAVLEDLATIDA